MATCPADGTKTVAQRPRVCGSVYPWPSGFPRRHRSWVVRFLNTPATGQDILGATFDDLPHQIALLDAHGTIILVNDAYVRFALDNGMSSPDGILGSNYLEICHQAAADGERDAALMAAALGEILMGDRQDFETVYACHSPYERRWFRLTIAKWEKGDQYGAVLLHENATPEIEAERGLLRAFRHGPLDEVQYPIAIRERMDALTRKVEYVTGHTMQATGAADIRALTAPDAFLAAIAGILLAGAQDGVQVEVAYAGRSVLLSITGLAAVPPEAMARLGAVPGRCDLGVQEDHHGYELDIMLAGVRREPAKE